MRRIAAQAQKAGLPPGSLVHVGRANEQETGISLIRYNETVLEEKVGKDAWQVLAQAEDPSFVSWVHLDGVYHPEVLEKLGQRFNIHALVLEDILNTEQRPKMEEDGDYIFLVLKMFSLKESLGEIRTEQVSLILGPSFVISCLENENRVFDPIKERIRKGAAAMRKRGAGFLAYSLLDAVVDSYFVILEGLGEKIELVEEELVSRPTRETLHLIYNLKREMIFFRKAVWPLREAVMNLERFAVDSLGPSISIYLRDVYDHLAEIIDIIETYRDMLSGMIDIYLSSISNRMNEVMKVLAIFSTLFMPLTFVAGVYGMNFSYMPELQWRWGYPLVLVIMAVTAGGMLVFFRKKKWF